MPEDAVNIISTISGYVLSALAVLIVLTIHEFSHAFAAYKLGDPTAQRMGRLTLNPIKHLDPIGALCMFFFHFGWAKPVPINARYFKKPRFHFALTALAGPASNLITAFFSALLYLIMNAFFPKIVGLNNTFVIEFYINIASFIYVFHRINVGIALFNLIPVPPLDGSRIFLTFLPPKAYFGIMKYERYIYFGLIGWLFAGDIVKKLLLNIPFISSSRVLSFAAGVFSLSDMLDTAFGYVSKLMFMIWELIPFL